MNERMEGWIEVGMDEGMDGGRDRTHRHPVLVPLF